MPRFDNIFEYPSNLSGSGLTVGIVMSRFNQDICEALLTACVAELRRLGVQDDDIEIATVAGALETVPSETETLKLLLSVPAPSVVGLFSSNE